MLRLHIGALGLLGLSTLASAQSKAPRPRPTVFTNVAIEGKEGAPRQHIVLREGRIETFLPLEQAPPAGYRVLDGSDLMALPAFVDAYSHAGLETPAPEMEQDRPIDPSTGVRIDMRMANRKGIQPHFHAADSFAMEDRDNEGYRTQGFGLLLSAPEGELLAGRSALANTHDAATRDRMVRPEVFDHAAFRASQDGGYPSTVMGYHAQLRQFFLDAGRHGILQQRFERGVPGSRPNYDRSLDAGLEILSGKRWLVCEAQSHRDIRRWLRLGDELGLRIAVSGGNEAFRLADVLAARGVPVFLTLDWGEEVEDPDEDEEQAAEEEGSTWIYREPLGVRRDRRRRWAELRDGALALEEAGVRLAFGSGSGRPQDLLESVRVLVEQGLPREAALMGLTNGAAELLGLGASYGRLEPGAAASLALWTADPLTDKDAQVRWMVVDGFVHEYEPSSKPGAAPLVPPDDDLDMNGRWQFTVNGTKGVQDLSLTMEKSGALTGTVQFENPVMDGRQEVRVEGSLSGRTLTLEARFKVEDREILWELDCKFQDDPDLFYGTTRVSGPEFDDENDCGGWRLPEHIQRKMNRDAVLSRVYLRGGAPNLPFVSRRTIMPICGCNRYHDRLGRHDDDEQAEDYQ